MNKTWKLRFRGKKTMNCLRAINICWWKHAIVVWVTSYTSEEHWRNDAVQWDKGATWSFCWKINLDGSFLIISQLASKSYGLACWTLSKLLPRFPAKSVPTEKLPFAKERPSTSWHTTRANSAGFLKQFLSKGMASYCKAETTFTFYFSIIKA